MGNLQLTNLRVQKKMMMKMKTRMNLRKVTITMTIQSISNLKTIKEKQKHKSIKAKPAQLDSAIQLEKRAG